MTATDRLRAMLDEQGVERYEHEAPATDCVAFFDGRGWHDCWESVDGEVNVTFSMTPEQAIAATLGAVEYRKPTTLSQLEAENAKLREELELWHRLTAGIELQEYPITEFKPKDLERENAKLRELVRDLYCLAYPSAVEWEVSDETYDKYSPCEKCHELHGGKSPCASTAKDMTEECCAPIQANVVADRMRDLGIEAGE